MESVLTVRLDPRLKQEGSAVMKRLGTTPSQAVRSLFDFAVKHDALPFSEAEEMPDEELLRRIRAFDCCHTAQPLTLTEDELRAERLSSGNGMEA